MIEYLKFVYQTQAFGFSQFAMFIVYAVIFICGAVFVRDYGVSVQGMFVSIFAILFAAFGAGRLMNIKYCLILNFKLYF